MLTTAFRFALELALVSIYTHSIVPIIATAPKNEADDEEVEHQEVKPEEQAAWSNLMTNPFRLQGPAYHLNPPVFDPVTASYVTPVHLLKSPALSMEDSWMSCTENLVALEMQSWQALCSVVILKLRPDSTFNPRRQ